MTCSESHTLENAVNSLSLHCGLLSVTNIIQLPWTVNKSFMYFTGPAVVAQGLDEGHATVAVHYQKKQLTIQHTQVT